MSTEGFDEFRARYESLVVTACEWRAIQANPYTTADDVFALMVEVARRDTKEKMIVGLDGIAQYVDGLLLEIQRNMYNKAKIYRDEHITLADTWDEFEKLLDEKGGFISAHWDGTPETEKTIKEKTKSKLVEKNLEIFDAGYQSQVE